MNSFHGPPDGSQGPAMWEYLFVHLTAGRGRVSQSQEDYIEDFVFLGTSTEKCKLLWRTTSKNKKGICEDFRLDQAVKFDPNLLLGLDMMPDPLAGSWVTLNSFCVLWNLK